MSDNWKGGYKTPPLANRFKPRQSGNPKGRPKKILRGDQHNPLDIIMRVLTQLITFEVNNRRRRAPAIEIVAELLARKVANGNSRAAMIAWELLDHVYAWQNQNIPNGQMEIRYVDWAGKVCSSPPPRTPYPAKK